MSTPIPVVVDSQCALTRAGIVHLLQQDGSTVRVVDANHEPPAQVTVYDLGDREGRDDLRLRRMVAGPTRVVVLLRRPRDVDVDAIIAMGAAEVASMEVSSAELVRSVETAAERASSAASPTDRLIDLQRATGLTARELEVLELIAAGLSNAELASHLYVSINTVKSCIRSAYKKIGVQSRSQAVGWALRQLSPVGVTGPAHIGGY